jgi:hypothetical protein
MNFLKTLLFLYSNVCISDLYKHNLSWSFDLRLETTFAIATTVSKFGQKWLKNNFY